MKLENNRSIYTEMIHNVKSSIVDHNSLIASKDISLRTSIIIYFHFCILYFFLNMFFLDDIKMVILNQIDSIDLLIEYSPILKAYFLNDLFLTLLFISVHFVIIPIGFTVTALVYNILHQVSFKQILSLNFIYASYIFVLYFIPYMLILYTLLAIVITSFINYSMKPDSKFLNMAYLFQTSLHIMILLGLIIINFI